MEIVEASGEAVAGIVRLAVVEGGVAGAAEVDVARMGAQKGGLALRDPGAVEIERRLHLGVTLVDLVQHEGDVMPRVGRHRAAAEPGSVGLLPGASDENVAVEIEIEP